MSIGYFRLLLALLVVLNHVDIFPKSGFTALGGASVLAFFWISGFLMAHGTRKYIGTYGRSAGIAKYAKNRLLRIYPMYFGALAVTYAAYRFLPDYAQVSREIFNWNYLLEQIFLIGHSCRENCPPAFLVNIAWSLNIELQWYILAPIFTLVAMRTLREKNGADALVFFAFAIAIASFFAEFGKNIELPAIVGSLSIFVAGYLQYWLREIRGSVLIRHSADLAAVAIFIGVLGAHFSPGIVLLCLLSAIFCYSDLTTRQSSSAKFAGDLSYPIFLFHVIPANYGSNFFYAKVKAVFPGVSESVALILGGTGGVALTVLIACLVLRLAKPIEFHRNRIREFALT